MEGYLAARIDIDIDAPAFAFGDMLIFPSGKMPFGRNNFNAAPAICQIVGLASAYLCRLRRPELVGFGEIAVVLEQVADDPSAIAGKIEQGGRGGDGRAAKQPRFQLAPLWRIIILAVEQGQPRFLLRFAGQGQVPHGSGIDGVSAVGFADAGQEIAKGKDALDGSVGQPEGCGNILDAAAFLDQAIEGFPFADLVGVLAHEILDERGFERSGIVIVVKNGARQEHIFSACLGDGLGGKVAPASSDDLVVAVHATPPHQERHQHAARPDRRSGGVLTLRILVFETDSLAMSIDCMSMLIVLHVHNGSRHKNTLC